MYYIRRGLLLPLLMLLISCGEENNIEWVKTVIPSTSLEVELPSYFAHLETTEDYTHHNGDIKYSLEITEFDNYFSSIKKSHEENGSWFIKGLSFFGFYNKEITIDGEIYDLGNDGFSGSTEKYIKNGENGVYGLSFFIKAKTKKQFYFYRKMARKTQKSMKIHSKKIDMLKVLPIDISAIKGVSSTIRMDHGVTLIHDFKSEKKVVVNLNLYATDLFIARLKEDLDHVKIEGKYKYDCEDIIQTKPIPIKVDTILAEHIIFSQHCATHSYSKQGGQNKMEFVVIPLNASPYT